MKSLWWPSFALFTLALHLPTLAQAQPSFFRAVSIEAMVLNADGIVIGQIKDFEKGNPFCQATIAVEETLRGEKQEVVRVLLQQNQSMLARWQADGNRIFIAFSGKPSKSTTFVDLTSKGLEVYRADLTMLTRPEDVIAAARETLRRAPGVMNIKTMRLAVPYKGEYGSYFGSAGRVSVDVPVDEKLEKRALEFIQAKNRWQREEGARALKFFKSDPNIALLKPLLKDPDFAISRRAEENAGIEVKVYPVRSAALATLQDWGVAVELPVVHEEIEKLDEVRSASLTGKKFAGAALRDLERFKNLERLDLRGATIKDADLVELARLKQLSSLSLGSTTITDAGLKHVAALKQLRSLILSSTNVTDAGMMEVAALKELRSLELGNCALTDAGLKHLAELQDLEFLFLDGTKITDAGLKELAGLKNLTGLGLRTAMVTPGGLKALAGLNNLNRLELGKTQVTDETLRVLREIGLLHSLNKAYAKRPADLPGYANEPRAKSAQEVDKLWLNDTLVTNDGLKELADLKNLAELRLDSLPITDAGLKDLAELKNLTSLSLMRTRVSDAGLKELAGHKKLTSLGLTDTNITDQGLREIRAFTQLESLWLPNTKITDAGLRELSGLKNLRRMNLSGTQITDQGLAELVALKNLTTLHLSKTAVTDAGFARLRVLLPKCEIMR